MLDETSIALLRTIFIGSTSSEGLNAIKFRAEHHEYLKLIDSLVSSGYIESRDGKYSLRLTTLPEIADSTPQVGSLLYLCEHLFRTLRQAYLNNPGEKISLDELSKLADLPRQQMYAGFSYLSEASLISGYSLDLSASDAFVTPAERLLSYQEFSQVIEEMRSWKTKSASSQNPFVEASILTEDRKSAFSNLNPDIPANMTKEEATESGSGLSVADTADQPNQHPELSSQASASSTLSSTPIEAEAESDLLDREKLTLALHRLLTEREDDHPFAIGLFGHWGTGKSSQVNFLQEKLKQTVSPTILFAEFNAWQNEKSTNLAAMLAQAVVDGLVADKSVWERIKLAVRLAALRHSHTRKAIEQDWRSLTVWLSWTWVVLPPVGMSLSLALLLLLVPLNGEWFVTFFKIMAWLSATAASGYHFIRSHLTELFKRMDMKKPPSMLSLPDYSSHQGLILEIHRTLRDLCTLCLTGNSPKVGSYLLLVVDDLDRCGVDTVKDVLDAVRLVANIPRVVTLVALDERMAFAAVEKHYLQFGHAGRPPELVARDYLAKVLQICVTLPKVTQDDIGNFVDKKIFGDIDLSQLASTAGESGAVSSESSEHRNGEMLSAAPSSIKQDAKLAEMTTLPAQPAPSESQYTSEVNQVSPRRSFLPEEKELFKQLAQAYDFSNPRLLWRHYMAWKLLKSLTLNTAYIFEDVIIPMNLLFWREWLHQLPYEQREEYSNWLKNSQGQNIPQGMPNSIYDTVKLSLRPMRDKALPMFSVVDAVLLPSNLSEATSTDELQKKNSAKKTSE